MAQIYLESKLPDLAEACLTAGLTFHGQNAAYLAPFLSYLLDQKKDSTALKIRRDLLLLLPSGSDREQLLAFAAATASFYLASIYQAFYYIRIANLKSRCEGRLLSAKITWDLGHQELALVEI